MSDDGSNQVLASAMGRLRHRQDRCKTRSAGLAGLKEE
jgi:hypothetical protein